MKKSVWIFLFAVLLPSVVLGWLALRSAEEQQIIFERRTAELYQKETEALAVTVRDAVDSERRAFGDTVHRLLAKGDPDALARDFTNTLADAWEVKAVGFAINRDGKLVSPSVAAASKKPDLQRFLLGNGGFLTSTEPAIVYNWAGDNNAFRNNKLEYVPASRLKSAENDAPIGSTAAKLETRNLGLAAATSKTKAVMPAAGGEFAKKRVGGIAGSKDGELRPEKAMTAITEDVDIRAPVPTISPAAPKAAPRIELKTTSATTKPQAVAAPAPAPLRKENDAGRSIISITPAPLPADTPPAPVAMTAPSEASRKADLSQAASKPDGMPGEQPAMTKGGSGALTLNSVNRQVEPQQVLGAQGPALSTVVPEEAEFRSLTEEGDDGMVARFVQDKLNLIFWLRPPEAPEMVFGCLVEAGHFADVWKGVLERHRSASRGGRASLESKPEYVLALLDDRGKPVATQTAEGTSRDWKHPFVASEIGEALPHWEAALYLASPTALAESARGLWRTLVFTIAGAVALIAFGGWLVVADARRQLALAQQKTDFVSNVSHELKTPLTSIRMFAELMHDRPQPAEKQGQYLRIITVEAERLTRLINNVLDFAKIGRKQKRLESKPLDLHEVVARVWESQELHLREAGFRTKWEAAPGPYPVLGDDDALAQVLVNLLSNAEKYSNGNKEVELHTWLDGRWVNVSVLDRGTGVPNGDEKKIFEAFYRAHDSLNSGIQGSGLGLTLAQRIAREHDGEIKLEHREGGGSRFTLRLPLAGKVEG